MSHSLDLHYTMARVKTTHYPSVLDLEKATALYTHMSASLPWVDGIYSSKLKTTTRLAHQASWEDREVLDIINKVLHAITEEPVKQFVVLGVYVNYYRDGKDWAPAHSHPGPMYQLIISLGATRQLRVGKKIYDMNNGDAIVFGGSTHEIIRDPTITEGRISIAVFLARN